MAKQLAQIEIYDKREDCIIRMQVEKLSKNKFRMIDNLIFNYRLNLGAEFETRVNKEGLHEIIKITKESDFLTRRFFLSTQYRKEDYLMLGEELSKRGGFWQTDFGGIVTINIPPNFEFDIDQIKRDLDITLVEIVDE